MEHKYIKKFIEDGINLEFPYLRRAVSIGRRACMDEFEASGLIGRGGAGFSTAAKWKFAWERENVVLICDGDEGEPGTFKDRYIMEEGAFLLFEGILISAFVLGASEVYLYIRGEYRKAIEAFDTCMKENSPVLEWYCKEVDPEFDLKVVAGGGAYVCGDETSLINSIEGKRPNSRIKPPFPAEKGLRGLPTIVNNVETLSNLPLIIRDGGRKFAGMGVQGSRGTKLICLSGSVKNPGLYEIEMGKVTFRDIIREFGNGCNDGQVKFVIPGGISTGVLDGGELDVCVDYKSLRDAGTSLGTGAVIVVGESVDAVDVACRAADFFMHETCGICFPCKEGNRQIHYLLKRISAGEGEGHYLDLIHDVAMTASCAARCGLGQACGNLICSLLDKFQQDFIKYLKKRR